MFLIFRKGNSLWTQFSMKLWASLRVMKALMVKRRCSFLNLVFQWCFVVVAVLIYMWIPGLTLTQTFVMLVPVSIGVMSKTMDYIWLTVDVGVLNTMKIKLNISTGFPWILKKSYFALLIFKALKRSLNMPEVLLQVLKGLKFLLKLNLCFHWSNFEAHLAIFSCE